MMTAMMLEVCCTHIVITDNLHAMGHNGYNSVNGIQSRMSVNSINNIPTSHSFISNLAHPLPNTHVGTALGHMHLAEPPILRRTPHVSDMNTLTTAKPSAKAVVPPNHRRQRPPRNLKAIMASEEVEDARRLM